MKHFSPASESSNLPSQTHHASQGLFPTPSLVDSVAAGAHYSGGLHPRRSASHTAEEEEIHEQHRRKSMSLTPHPLHEEDRRESVREPLPEHAALLQDLGALYECRPSVEIFERSWSKDAVYEGSYCKAHGYAQYAPQWFAFPKLYSSSETVSRRVMLSTHNPNRLVFSQTQRYTLRLVRKQVTIQSIVLVDLDENNKIIKLVDQWDGKDLPTRYGAHYLRRAYAIVAPWLLSAPKAFK